MAFSVAGLRAAALPSPSAACSYFALEFCQTPSVLSDTALAMLDAVLRRKST